LCLVVWTLWRRFKHNNNISLTGCYHVRECVWKILCKDDTMVQPRCVCVWVEGKTVRRRFRFPRAFKRDVEKSTMVIIKRKCDIAILYYRIHRRVLASVGFYFIIYPDIIWLFKIVIDMKNGCNCIKLPALKLFVPLLPQVFFVIFSIFF